MSDNIIIGKHTLESLTSGMYADPFVVFREYVQNCVDSIDNAVSQGILKRGEEQITVRLSPLERRIVIRDNGLGIASGLAEKTLISIGNSKKTSENSRGFRGIGRLSALSYCEKLTFITSSQGESCATKIVIDADKLADLLSSDTGEDVTAVEVLQSVYTIETTQEKENAHYFLVQLDGVKDSSKLNSYDEVVDYLAQNVPVPYSPDFVWGKEITNRIKREGYSIDVYNVYVIYGTVVMPIYKPYRDEFLVDKNKNISDHIHDIDIVKIDREDGSPCAIGWLAKTNYLGSIYDKSIKGIRLRKGNILVGDQQTLNVVFKDARFNGWSIGEFFAIDTQLIPNARRDNFEKNIAYFSLFEQLSHLSATIAKDIRAASLMRNSELSNAMKQIEVAKKAASEAIGSGVTASQKGSITQKLKSAQNAVANSYTADSSGEYYQGIAFEELDMIIGKLKGATSYKALNTISNLTNTEKKILERIFNTILNSGADNADEIIDSILFDFSSGSQH